MFGVEVLLPSKTRSIKATTEDMTDRANNAVSQTKEVALKSTPNGKPAIGNMIPSSGTDSEIMTVAMTNGVIGLAFNMRGFYMKREVFPLIQAVLNKFNSFSQND